MTQEQEKTWTVQERAANRRKWIAALRSGEFKQCNNGALYHCGSYCCIGVGATIMGWTHESDEDVGYTTNQKAMGIDFYFGSFAGGQLTNLNDNNVSFNEIADIIESNPPGLLNDEDANYERTLAAKEPA